MRSDKTKEEGSSETASHSPRAKFPSEPPSNVIPLTSRPLRSTSEIEAATARRLARMAEYQAQLAAEKEAK